MASPQLTPSDSETRRLRARRLIQKRKPWKCLFFFSTLLGFVCVTCAWTLFQQSWSHAEFAGYHMFELQAMEVVFWAPALIFMGGPFFPPPLSIFVLGFDLFLAFHYGRLVWRVRQWRPMFFVLLALVGVPLSTAAVVYCDGSRRVAFGLSRRALEGLRAEIESAPPESEPFEGAQYVGLFLVRRALRDERGGVYFDLVMHSGFFESSGWRHEGFVYRPNAHGAPFAEEGLEYRTARISGDWHAFHYQVSSR